ncbi:DUF2919 family protein [Psychrobium sp. nBUS_13]|uniref:DUF2919 family protein n=1 Tax=Psychrobium sp. nBUS_13 TaxID=3395319 RepID=UPI003EBAAD4F
MRYNPFRDYDKYGCIKLPLMLFLSLGYLIKGYVIWVVSLSYRKDPSVLLNIFYPSRADFYHALIIAIPAVFCVIIFSLRRIGMPTFVAWLWHRIRFLLIGSALVQIGDSVWQGNISLHNIIHFNAYYGVLIDVIFLVGIIVYCMLNQRVIDVSKQYPIALDDDN